MLHFWPNLLSSYLLKPTQQLIIAKDINVIHISSAFSFTFSIIFVSLSQSIIKNKYIIVTYNTNHQKLMAHLYINGS